MLSGQQLWNYGAWLLRAIAERQDPKPKKQYARLVNPLLYGPDDYGVRKKGDHYESYNKITGESLYEAMTEREARMDIQEEFL